MAITSNKRNIYLGQTVEEQVKNIDNNFTELYDNEDDLQTQLDEKEPKIATKNTAFNKNYSTSAPKANGTASAGSADNIARGDHVHPTDTTRLAVSPDGTNTLLDDSNKIRNVYLPSSLTGAMVYKGAFDATTGLSLTSIKKGDYYICSKAGKKDPEGHTVDDGYEVGDWAVYSGRTEMPFWDKIDNTDAVTMVNGQIGAVKTYKGSYSSAATYYQGDIVLSNSCLYLFINGTPTAGKAVTDADYWQIFGKVYSNATTTADGLMSKEDKAKVHDHSNKALLDTYTQTEANLADAVSKKHSHSNKTLLDTYDQTNVNIKDAVTKKHSHSNKTVLDNTTASYTTEEKTKLGKIDDSLLDITADDIGKVKDVKVNGTSVLGTDGVANVAVPSLKKQSVGTTSSMWSTKTLNGATYNVFVFASSGYIVPIFLTNEDNQQIVAMIIDTGSSCEVYFKNKQAFNAYYIG